MTLELIIKSPVGFDPAVYNWPKENQDNNGALEIIETIKWVFEDFPDLNLYFQKETIFKYDSRCYESMKILCDLYNDAIDKLIERNPKGSPKFYKKASVNLIRHIILQAYNQSVVDPEKLNQYEPFSPEVYGETSFEFIRQMIEEINIKNEDVFIDLGSGVGQVVLQVAACTSAKLCIGIEKAEVPAIYSEGMSDAFKFWMNWYGKQFCDYHLMKGDFFNEKYRDTINNGTFIFVNNFAFGPEVDHKLKLRFQELKDGARIVSSKAFCPLNFRITDRTLSDIGSIMQVEEIQPKYKGSVSWTGKPVSYYLHTIDRRKLEEFFLNSRAPKNKFSENNEMTKNRKSSSKNQNNNFSSSTEFCSNTTKFKEDSLVFGPTTRKAWSEWCKNTQKDLDPNDKNCEASNDSNISEKKDFQNKIHAKNTNSNCSLDDYKLMTSDSESSLDTLIDQENKDEKQIVIDDTDNFSKEKSIKNSKSKKQFKVQSNSDSNDSKRPPGRPRKKNSTEKSKKNLNLDGLDLLHQQTVLSISSTSATEIPPGCIDKKLSFADNNLSETINLDKSKKNLMNQSNLLDKIESTHKTIDLTENGYIKETKPKFPFLEYNLSLDSLVDNFKNQMTSFLEQMKNESYKNSILQEIEKEKKINSDLKSRIETLNLQVEENLSKGLQSLKLRLNQIDITANDPNELFLEASEILEKNKELKSQVKQFENQVNNLDLINQKYNQLHTENKKIEDKKILEKNSDLKLNFDKKNNGLVNDKPSKNELKDISKPNLLINNKVNNLTTALKKNCTDKKFYDNQFTQQYNAQLLSQNVQAQYNQLIYQDNLNLSSSNNKILPIKSDPSFYSNQSLNNLKNTSSINLTQNTSTSSTIMNNNLQKNSNVTNNLSQKKSNNIQTKLIKEKSWTESNKEKITNSSRCNNAKNQNLSKENGLNETFSNDKKNGTYQFPELEDRIKSMIVAAFNDGKKKDEQAALQKVTKPRKPRVTKAKNVKNEEKVDLASINLSSYDSTQNKNSFMYNNQSSNSSNQMNSSKNSLDKTNNVDSFLKQPGSLFQNLHNHNLASYGSFINNKKPQSNEDNREGSALKLTLKIDREKDSYTLVKSPSKSPEKVTPKCSPKYLDHLKRKHNISPDHKNKRSKSPKYSSSIQPVYEPEKRLILKVTNGQSCHIEIPKV